MANVNSISEDARTIWQSGVAAVDAGRRLEEFVKIDDRGISFGDEIIPYREFRNIVVVGCGKSAGAMATALDKILDELPVGKKVFGQVNVPDDCQLTTQRIQIVGCRPAGINLPTERVLTATDSMIELLSKCDPSDLVIGLFSGGGSALLERPVDGVSLRDLQEFTMYLSREGASIEELNCVRSRLSLVKRGGLARMIPAQRVVSLLISDVFGDSIEVIASGPSWIHDAESGPEKISLTASDVVARYAQSPGLIPDSVVRVLGFKHQPLRALHRFRPRVKHFVIANNQVAVEAAFAKANSLGYQGNCETDPGSARAEEVAGRLCARLKLELKLSGQMAKKGCLISGGEPTVQVKNPKGRGGRNQQLVLAAIESILSFPDDFATGERFSFLSAGTDGEDGNVSVAGAQFDSTFIRELNRELPQSIELARQHLHNSDSYGLLEQWNCLFRAGNTNTNVCDLRVLLWEARK